jgi:hypothetical protein
MFFKIKVKEQGDFIHLSFVTKADKLLLESIFSKKIRLFFKLRKKAFLFLPYYIIPKALAFELAYIFLGAYKVTNKARYGRAFVDITNLTWLKQALKPMPVTIDESKFNQLLTLSPLPYKKNF